MELFRWGTPPAAPRPIAHLALGKLKGNGAINKLRFVSGGSHCQWRWQLDVFPLNHPPCCAVPFRPLACVAPRRDGEINLLVRLCLFIIIFLWNPGLTWCFSAPPSKSSSRFCSDSDRKKKKKIYNVLLKRPNIHSNSGLLLSVFQSNIFSAPLGLNFFWQPITTFWQLVYDGLILELNAWTWCALWAWETASVININMLINKEE